MSVSLPLRPAVLGLGRSGLALARFFAARHLPVRGLDLRQETAIPAATEIDGLEVRGGGYSGADLEGMDSLYVSPGIAWDDPLVQAARERGLRVSSELELFLQLSGARLLAVTGTNGKTTTASWVHHLLREAGRSAELAGNVGRPALELLELAEAPDWVVLELSSYQLEALEDWPELPFWAAALLNVSPDHLARHGTLERYAEIKGRILSRLPGPSTPVANRDDPVVAELAARAPAPVRWFGLERELGSDSGAQLSGDWICLVESGRSTPLLPAGALRPPGAHNVSNAMAAALLARAAGLDPQQLSRGLASFNGVEHRIEPVGGAKGISYYNDSKATNPESVLSALSALEPRPVVLIAGGQAKGTGFEELAARARVRCRAAVLIGEAAPELEAALRRAGLARVQVAADMDHAVLAATSLAEAGDVVLLSPACASFDQYRDFEERGRDFKRAVSRLLTETEA